MTLNFFKDRHNLRTKYLINRQSITFLSDEHTTSLYSDNLPKLLPGLQENLPRKFIQFLHDCIVNLLRGELRDIQKGDVKKYQDEIHPLSLKRTGINERRAIFSSRKGIELLQSLTPSIINRLFLNGIVCFVSSSALQTKVQTKSV